MLGLAAATVAIGTLAGLAKGPMCRKKAPPVAVRTNAAMPKTIANQLGGFLRASKYVVTPSITFSVGALFRLAAAAKRPKGATCAGCERAWLASAITSDSEIPAAVPSTCVRLGHVDRSFVSRKRVPSNHICRRRSRLHILLRTDGRKG